MNKAILVGRLTREPELKTTQSGASVTSFSLAVQKRFKDANGEYGADFIDCVAWKNTAEFICKNFGKGRQIGVVGSIQTRNYDDRDGKKVYVTEVVVDEAYFVGDKGNGAEKQKTAPPMPVNEGFMPMPNDEPLPF